MKLRRVLVVAVTFVAFGLLTVWQHVEMVRLGRKIRELERTKTKLEQEYSKLELEVKKFKSPEYLIEKARELGLDVGLPENAGCGSNYGVPGQGD
ncbi:MAG: septum formation initiator family protein [Planctomycetota bacterium]